MNTNSRLSNAQKKGNKNKSSSNLNLTIKITNQNNKPPLKTAQGSVESLSQSGQMNKKVMRTNGSNLSKQINTSHEDFANKIIKSTFKASQGAVQEKSLKKLNQL